MEEDIPIEKWPEWKLFHSIRKSVSEVKELSLTIEPDRIGVFFPFVDSILESMKSLEILARNEYLRDAYVISRVIFETSLNASFLLTDPKIISKRAQSHAKQKILRDLIRVIRI
ncbi:DUF5677 domain-containing protein [Acetobacter estunensis]|uniref:DUF5677 domain-containing protein n=1 Tax=Acetobacter estunensis TaxID=104097 RepID=UPI0034A02E20